MAWILSSYLSYFFIHTFIFIGVYDEIRCDLLDGFNATLSPHGFMNLSNKELLNIILYGHEILSLELNAKILCATLHHI